MNPSPDHDLHSTIGRAKRRAVGITRPLAALLAGATIVVGTACATTGAAADTTSSNDSASIEQTATSDETSGDLSIFDSTAVHELAVSFDEEDYTAMLATFTETGEKEWIEATVTIDGVTYEQVGLRLKGNSSLMSLQRGDAAAALTPEELPWLIRLDEFVDGQAHQGYEDLVVRSNNTETSLNEAVALTLLDEAGLASEQAISTSFSVNGSDEVLRLVVEHPSDDAWYEANFDGDGALYKAESGGDWSYRGDDAEAYEDVFDQEGGDDVAGLEPLTEFLDFINNSSDEDFATELPDRLDVDAFATYLAMMDLTDNFDDIDGPGNNAYLWWDAESDQFTVVPWDLNLAFGVRNEGGGGGGDEIGGAAGGGVADGGRPIGDAGGGPPQRGNLQPPVDGNLQTPLPAGDGAVPGGDRGAGPNQGGNNPLVERFLANDEFSALYAERTEELRTALIDGGVLDAVVAEWGDLLVAEAGDLVAADTVGQEAASISGS